MAVALHLVRKGNLRIEILFAALRGPSTWSSTASSRLYSKSTKAATSSTATDGDGPDRATSSMRPTDVPLHRDCQYELPEIVETYPFALVCNMHSAFQLGEHWVAMYVDEIGDYFDPYGQAPQHVEYTNFMNAHCSEWSANDRTLQSPLSTVCGHYCVVFLTLRCRNVLKLAFRRLFTTDLIANDCCVFDWLGVRNRK